MDRSKQTTKPDPVVSAATALQVFGVVILSIGLGFIHVWIGLVAFGVGLVLIGVAMELN